jgi:glycosyltransferase involved in cell wall biosynthesis
MSRELLGFAIIALACIIFSPLYNNKYQIIHHKKNDEVHNVVVRAKSPKSIVLLTDSFLPDTFAGSEISAYETIKYLRSRGHHITIFVKNLKSTEYDGFKMNKYDINDQFCKETILNSDAIFFQMSDEPESLKIINEGSKQIYVFIHLVNTYQWILQQRMPFPVTVVYNSHMTQDSIPTLHSNMRMIPYVDTDKFKSLRLATEDNDVVCLINCNKNKGGELLIELARKMPDTQFIGVKGGYSKQVVDTSLPNLHYMENQRDVTVVFKKIGILIMPSVNETWGRTAVEAMASGVPVIHSEASGLVECVSGAGIECSNYDIYTWVNAINRINGDPIYREKVRQNGFSRIREIEKEQTRGRQELAIKLEA